MYTSLVPTYFMRRQGGRGRGGEGEREGGGEGERGIKKANLKRFALKKVVARTGIEPVLQE